MVLSFEFLHKINNYGTSILMIPYKNKNEIVIFSAVCSVKLISVLRILIFS